MILVKAIPSISLFALPDCIRSELLFAVDLIWIPNEAKGDYRRETRRISSFDASRSARSGASRFFNLPGRPPPPPLI